MSRYVISDLHLGHANIIEYCNRPFESGEEMNAVLVENWNSVVDAGDVVFLVGDLAMAPHETAVEFARQLNGSILLVKGNHDEGLDVDRVPFPVVSAYEFSVEKYNFYCTHRPEDIVASAEWGLSGHVHNNDLREYPFIDPDKNRVNVSAELLGYTPLSVSRLAELLDRKERMVRVPENEAIFDK